MKYLLGQNDGIRFFCQRDFASKLASKLREPGSMFRRETQALLALLYFVTEIWLAFCISAIPDSIMTSIFKMKDSSISTLK